MQARYKHMIARYSQGERRRARFEQARLIEPHKPDCRERPPMRRAAHIALWLHVCVVLLLLSGLMAVACARGVS